MWELRRMLHLDAYTLKTIERNEIFLDRGCGLRALS